MHILSADASGLKEALTALGEGGVISCAADSNYVLLCDLANKQAVQLLFDMKKKPKSLFARALFSSVEQAKQYVEWNEEVEEQARKHLPGAAFLRLPIRQEVRQLKHPILQAGMPLSVTITSSPVAQLVVYAYGRPLRISSAHLYGRLPCLTAQAVAESFVTRGMQPHIILDSGRIEAPVETVVIDLMPSFAATKRETVRRP